MLAIPTAGRQDLLRSTLTSISMCRIPERYAGASVVEHGARRGFGAPGCAGLLCLCDRIIDEQRLEQMRTVVLAAASRAYHSLGHSA